MGHFKQPARGGIRVCGLDGCIERRRRGVAAVFDGEIGCSYPVWEDFSAKATKLHSQLRTTVLAAVAFLDAFQKVADMATNTRGMITSLCVFYGWCM
ncbi:hypothetical protein INR49_001751 [Caranx melampygus]|nr:hypothetical protein INR49_001751 [Caranx melampygus]